MDRGKEQENMSFSGKITTSDNVVSLCSEEESNEIRCGTQHCKPGRTLYAPSTQSPSSFVSCPKKSQCLGNQQSMKNIGSRATISAELDSMIGNGHGITTNNTFQDGRNTREQERPSRNNDRQHPIHLATNQNDTAFPQTHETFLLRDPRCSSTPHTNHSLEQLLHQRDSTMQQKKQKEIEKTHHQQFPSSILTNDPQSQNQQPVLVNPQPNNLVFISNGPSNSTNQLLLAINNYHHPTELGRISNVTHESNPVILSPSTPNTLTPQYSENYRSISANSWMQNQETDLKGIDFAIERRESELEKEYEELKKELARLERSHLANPDNKSSFRRDRKRHIYVDPIFNPTQRQRLNDIHKKHIPIELNSYHYLQSEAFLTLCHQQQMALHDSKITPTQTMMMSPFHTTKCPSHISKAKRVFRSVEERIEELKEYKKKHGHCNVPRRSRENQSLGVWCNNIRYSYSQIQDGKHPHNYISKENIKALNDLGFMWTLRK